MSDFLTNLRSKLQDRINERIAAKAELDAILAEPAAEARDLNDAETQRFAAAKDRVHAADADIDNLNARIADLEAIEARRVEAAKVHQPAAVVRREARTYSRDAERAGVSFLNDVAARIAGHVPGAAERLERHMAEERVERPGVETRAAGTTAFAGLVVPQYLTDLVAPAVAAMRPTANLARKWELPAVGMTVNISRITTATSAALQASENSAVSETNIDDTLLSPAVLSAAGQQTISLQALNRGIGTESVVVGDLVRRVHTVIDSTMLNQATTGLDAITVGSTIAYTDATPTAPELYPKLFALISQVQSAAYMGVSHFVMHPRRWNWLASQVGTSWPFLQVAGAGSQTGGSYNGSGSYGVSADSVTIAGTLAGVPVVLDASIATNFGAGTNEDRIYGITADEAHLWEDPNAPLFIRAEQPAAASLGVLFVVYSYFAYTFSRYPSAHASISGTGMVTPTF